ncbi:hypothetical protein COV19_03960 [Candidatus Woesearchaeota archaeon CG10_big_fil_rev_8_21_14_0_10_44_13]|nr:MAG: hypothetical protein COV19_03960 [Candidatus Woesearchaeota archaeon CG10_big_fil_rev_8_21_14_0_10_44_13]
MAMVGFNFTKISAERKAIPRGKLGVKNNVSIKEVEKTDLFLGSLKQNGLKILFEFRSIYEPKIGEILLEGEILDMEDEKIIEDVLKGWKKSKKLPDGLMNMVINSILGRCNIQALIMSKELNMPPPIPMPKVAQQQTAQK